MATKSVYDPITKTTKTQYTPDAPIAPTSQPTTTNLTERTNQLLGGNYFNTQTGAQMTPYQPPTTPPVINSTNLSATTTPVIPTPAAPPVNEALTAGMTADLLNQRKAVEASYKAEQARLAEDKKATQAKIDNFTALQQTGVIDQVNTLTQPFREQLETSERQRLYVDENFQANQKLTNELDSLLTQGNELIKQQKAEGGLASIATANLNKTISDVNARAGVIQAVMSARNGQIGQAYNMIDRSVNAINADRKDRLNYFSTLYNFYSDQKNVEQNKLLSLTKEEDNYIKAQIGLIENDLAQTQKNADRLKEAMTDPDTALAYATAGVTLNDTPEQINEKLAKYAPIKEARDTAIKMAEKYPDAGIVPGDTLEMVNRKVKNSAIYRKQIESTKTTTSITPGGKNSGILELILASGKFTKDQAAVMSTAINNGEDAFTVVKNNAKNIMGQTLATDLDKAETAKSQLEIIDSKLKEFYAAGGKTGVFTGNFEKTVNKLGETNDPRLVGIATSIALAMQSYRLAVTGTAASVQEDARIDNVFPGITNGEVLNNARTQATIQSFNDKIDASYRNVLGSAYDQLKNSTVKGGVPDANILVDLGAKNPAYQSTIIKTANDNPTWSPSDVLQYIKSTIPNIKL